MEDETQVTQDVETTETEEAVEVDWKAEAEKYKSQATNLNKALHEARSKKPDDVQAAIQKGLQEIERKRVEDDIEDIAASLAASDEEKQKMLDVYRNRLTSTGFSRRAIQDDLQSARLLANKDKYLVEAEKKAKKSLAERTAMGTASVKASATESEDSDEESYSEAENKFLASQKAAAGRFTR